MVTFRGELTLQAIEEVWLEGVHDRRIALEFGEPLVERSYLFGSRLPVLRSRGGVEARYPLNQLLKTAKS